MTELSEKELEYQRNMEEDFNKQWQKEYVRIKKELAKEQKSFLTELNQWCVWNGIPNHPLIEKLYQGLKSGAYKKPSEFLESELIWLFDGIIFPNVKKYVFYAVDNCIKWQYSHSYSRRSFRTNDYSIHLKYILQTLLHFMNMKPHIMDICAIRENKIDIKEYTFSNHTICRYEEMLAYELDHGNQQLEKFLTEIIMGEGEEIVTNKIIRGIVRSDNTTMHNLLCKLLVAARLQEGLRQAICENADAGTVSAFMAIVKTIIENDFIRFSAVKRAVGTWLGLFNEEMAKLERISNKSIEYIAECIENPVVRQEFLASEDSMKIYIALWAYGFYEAKDAICQVLTISKEGTKHQILTAGYFVANLDNDEFAHNLAKGVMKEHKEDMEVLAVFLPYFMKDWYLLWTRAEDGTKYLQNYYYQDEEQAEAYYVLLWDMYQSVPKKSLEFSPCIFPWYSAVLKKSDVVVRLCVTAFILQDSEKIDTTCALIKDCDADDRWKCLKMILEHPGTPKQKEVFTELLSNRDSYTRSVAYKMMENVTLDSYNYRQIEAMLKYKAADMRANLIALLLGQEEEQLYDIP